MDLLAIDPERASQAIKKRFNDNKLLYYLPCCKVHDPSGERLPCPANPCLSSKHAQFHMSDKKIRIVFGGNRAGKSILGLSEMLMLASLRAHPYRGSKNPGKGRYRIYNSDYGIIEKLTLALVQEWIPKSVLRGEGETKGEAWKNSYDTKYHILRLKNDVMIDFMSYDQDADKSESVELDGVWADEEIPENIFSAVLSRLISRNGKFWMTVTPLYGLSWGMKFLDGTDPNCQVFTLDIMDNPYLTTKMISEFESSLPEHEKEARLHGKFLDLQGVVYKGLRADAHLVDVMGPKVGDPVIMALDPHPRKPSVIVWSYVNNKDEVVFFDELEISGNAFDIVQAIRYKESNHESPTILRLNDPAARAQGSNIAFETDTLKEFERQGMGFTLADNSEAGYSIVHEFLRYDDRRERGFFNKPQAYFTRAVPKTWYAMTHLMWEDWSNPNMRARRDKKEKIVDHGKDFPDCVRYILATRPTFLGFRNAKPVPIGNVANLERFKARPVRDYFFGRT